MKGSIGIGNWSIFINNLIKNHNRLFPLHKSGKAFQNQIHSSASISKTNSRSGFIELDVKVKVNETWLRHHCRCAECFSWDTNERKDIPIRSWLHAKVKQLRIEGEDLHVDWNDGHQSKFCRQSLFKNLPQDSERISMVAGQDILSVCPVCPDFFYIRKPLEHSSVSYKDLMSTESAVSELLRSILKCGYGVVNHVNGLEETVLSHNRISHPIRTMYGEGVTVHSPDKEHNDAAYSNVPLPLHTDTSYFTEPIGLQSFHILSRNGTGGLNCFSDSFLAAKILYDENPSMYHILTQIQLPFQYLEKGKYDLQAIGPTFKLHELTGRLAQVRYNPRHVTALSHLHTNQIEDFYEAWIRFTEILNENQIWIQLNPGTILWIDNWRILHGRSGFTGSRSVASAYFPRSDWLSRARILGLNA